MIIIIGNKTDKVDQRTVTNEQATAKAKELDVIYMEVSAKTGDNISELFKNIAKHLPNGD